MIYFLTVNYYSTNLITRLINSLKKNYHDDYRIVIVNNSPDDSSIHDVKNEFVTIIDSENNLGFGGACNLGIQYIYTQNYQSFIWMINPDAYLQINYLEKVNIFFASHPEVSIIGTIIHTPTGKTWFAGGHFIAQTGKITTNTDLLDNQKTDYVPCDWVSGCSLIINLRQFNECPFFDTAYFLYYEDFDFCQRYQQQGHLVAVTQLFGVIHQPSSITNKYIFRKIKHSTYSYLLTLARYSNNLVIVIRLIRVIIYALLLIFIRPKIALAKFFGVFMYLKKYCLNL